MKIFIHLFFILTLVGCKTKQTTLITEKQKFIASSDCQEDGVCSVEIIPDSFLSVKTDEFGHIYTTIEKGEKVIFKFTYSRIVDEKYVDGQYAEEIYAEFDQNLPEINLKNKNLSKVKLLFNRMCYCKGSAGFYHVENGELSFKKTGKNTYNIQLNFKMDKVPQVIRSINETFTLD